MPRKKALKVIVDVHFHAVTCPGVFLPEQQDVFLNIDALGQRKRTASTPPVFPFLFHEKLRFEKVFSHATDPVQVASALSGETVRIELVQLTYPGGELLATYEDNAREFLFPTPRVSPTYPGVDREILLQRSSAFPGIAPKLEFSSRTIIKEVTSVGGSGHSKRKRDKALITENDLYSQKHSGYTNFTPSPIEASTPHVQSHHQSSSNKKKTPKQSNIPSSRPRSGRTKTRSASLSRASTQRGYEQSTIASRARSPSPYTRRRMAQLSLKDPFESAVKTKPFKTELEERPEFVVRKAAEDTLSSSKAPPPLPHVTPSPERRRTTPSPRNSSYSPGRRKQTPGKYLYGTDRVTRDIDSEGRQGISELIASDSDSSTSENECANPHLKPASQQSALKSAYYRPITSGCYAQTATQDSQELKEYINQQDWKSDMEFSRHNTSYGTWQKHAPVESCSQSDVAFPLSRPCVSRKRRGHCNVRFKNTAELINSSLHQRTSRPTSAQSAPESYRTPRRDLSFSNADDYEDPISASRSKLTPSSILFRKPLRERFGTNEPSPYEKIRDRVRDLLRSPRANQIVDDSISEANERYWARRSRTPSPRSPRSSVTVRLGADSYWNDRASEYTGQSHRQVFEDSMDKIYDDIYHHIRSDA